MSTIFLKRPNNFKDECSVSCCFIECQGRYLILQREPNKYQGGAWAVPAGKIENEELPDEAMVRELNEEIGLVLETEDLNVLRTIYIRHSTMDYTLHIFALSYYTFPPVFLNLKENSDFKWVNFSEMSKINLIDGQLEILSLMFAPDARAFLK